MADVKISQLPAATTPVDGTEVLPIVQSATTKQVSIANLTAGRAMAASSLTLTTPLAATSGGTGIATAAQGSLLSATAADTFSATRTPTLGLAGTAAGTLGLSGLTSGVVTLQTAAAAGTWAMTLPTSGGTNGYILTTNGSGVTSWTNPTALGVDLDVGTTAITNGTAGNVLFQGSGDVLQESANLFWDNTNSRLGIGTTAPGAPFATGSSTDQAQLAGGLAGATSALYLGTQNSSGTGGQFNIKYVRSSGVTSFNLASLTSGTPTTTNLMTFSSVTGAFCMGGSPSAWGSGISAVEVPNNGMIAAQGALYILGNAYYDTAFKYTTTGTSQQYSMGSGGHNWGVAASGTAGTAITYTTAMTLTTAGNLGIGTTSPAYRLDVGAGSAVEAIRVNGSNSGTGGGGILAVHNNGTFYGGFGNVSAIFGGAFTNVMALSGFSGLNFYTNNLVRLAISTGGALTSAQTYAQAVGGTNRAMYVDSTGLIGNLTSIRAAKTDITPITNVSWLYKLDPVTFFFRKKDEDNHFTDEQDGDIQYGLIAEDVEKVNVDFCDYDLVDGERQLRGVHYNKFIVPLIVAVKELSAKLDAATTRIAALETH